MKTNRLLLLTGVLCFFTLLADDQAQKPRKMDLYLLIGQSNMAGRGVVEPEDQETHPRVWTLTKEGTWRPAAEPLHFDKPGLVGVGPGLAFGKAMAEAAERARIGLIPCAVGGSAIESWTTGGLHAQTQAYPYDEALKRARRAMRKGKLRGIIWHQGESDSSPEKAELYAARLAELITRLRQELKAPELPFVAATLPDFFVEKSPAAASVNQVLRELPTQVPHTACVETGKAAHKGDETHLDTPSARWLGRQYAEAMLKLQQQ
jgi:hypothetical protein